jgi:hypothetical protein
MVKPMTGVVSARRACNAVTRWPFMLYWIVESVGGSAPKTVVDLCATNRSDVREIVVYVMIYCYSGLHLTLL